MNERRRGEGEALAHLPFRRLINARFSAGCEEEDPVLSTAPHSALKAQRGSLLQWLVRRSRAQASKQPPEPTVPRLWSLVARKARMRGSRRLAPTGRSCGCGHKPYQSPL